MCTSRFSHITWVTIVLSIVLHLAGCGGGGGGSNGSNTAVEEIDTMTASMESAADYYQVLIDSGKSHSVAVSETIDWLKKQEGVTDAYLDTDGQNIFVEDKTEIITLIITDSKPVSRSSTVSNASSILSMLPVYKAVTETGSSLKSIFLDPYQFDLPNIDTILHILEDNAAVDIEVVTGSNVTPDTFKNLSEFDIIYYLGHGGINPKTGKTSIGTGEIFTEDRLNEYKKIFEELHLDPIDENGKDKYVYRFVVKDLGLLNIKKKYISTFGITNHYIEQFAKDLKASVVYVDACVTMAMGDSSTMAIAFVDKGGAETYLGWDKSINYYFDDTYNYLNDFFSDLFDEKDVGTAYNNLNFDTFTGAELKLYGGKGTKIIRSTTSVYTVSGRVTSNGSGLAGVKVSLSGLVSSSTVTDSKGSYNFTNVVNGSYTLTPSLTGYTFNPSSRSVIVSNGNVDVSDMMVIATPVNPTHYTITDLGYGYPKDINDSGQAVGSHSTTSGYAHAFLYSNGTMTDLGTLGLTSYANGINNSGQVVGYSAVDSYFTYHAFFYSNGTMADFASIDNRFSNGSNYANDINNNGDIVGTVPSIGAFLYSNGTLITLGTLGGGATTPNAINNSGQVVGWSMTSNGNDHAFLYSNGVMTDLGTLSGDLSAAHGINNSGQVVGFFRIQVTANHYDFHAFLYSNGSMTDLGTLGGDGIYDYSYARGISDSGQVVGYSRASDGYDHAFLYSNGVMTDLNSLIDTGSGWILEDAKSINNVGQILVQATYGGSKKTFILTPIN